MNTHTNLILVKGRIVTNTIYSIEINDDVKTIVCYHNDPQREYTYNSENVLRLTNPKNFPLPLQSFQIYKEIIAFEYGNYTYYHVFLLDGSEYDSLPEYHFVNYLEKTKI